MEKNKEYEKIANRLLDDIFEKAPTVTSIDVRSGLVGIGLGIHYLVKEKFVRGKDGITNIELYTEYMIGADPLFENECVSNCPYFPICNGGCPFLKLKQSKEGNVDICLIQKDKLTDFFTLYYRKNETKN